MVQTGVAVLASLVAAVAVLAMVASVRPLPLGDWVSAAVEARLADRLAQRGLVARVGDLDVAFLSGLVPVITARNIDLHRDGDTVPLVSLESSQIVLHRDSAALGMLRPKALLISGVTVTAVTSGDELSLDLGRASVVAPVSSPGELIAAVRDLLDQPMLVRLEELGVSGMDLRLDDQTNGWAWRSGGGDLRISRAQDLLTLNLSLSELGAPDQPGRVTLRLSSDLAQESGSLTFSARGLNPAYLLPGEGAHLLPVLQDVDAPLSVQLSADLLPGGLLGPMEGRVSVGQGHVPLPDGRRLTIDHATARLSVPEGQRHLHLSDLSFDSDLVAFQGRGQVVSDETPLGVLRSASAQLSLQNLRLAPGWGMAGPIQADLVEALINYDHASGRITLGPSYVISDGQTVQLSGYVIPPDPTAPPVPAASEAEPTIQSISLTPAADEIEAPIKRPLPEGWQAGFDLAADHLSAQTAVDFWPELVAPKARTWVAQNIMAGDMQDARLSLRLPVTGRADTGLSLRFHDVAAWASPRLPIIEGGRGFLSIQDGFLAVQVDDGHLPLPDGKRVEFAEALVVKSNLRVPDMPLDITGQATASVPAVLTLLQQPLFQPKDGTGEALPFGPDDVAGAASVGVKLQIPMGPDRDQRRPTFQVTGQIADIATEALLPGRSVAAQTLAVAVTNDAVAVSGAVTLDGFPADVTWNRPLGAGPNPSVLDVAAPLSQGLAASFGVPIKPNEMTGAGTATARIVLEPGQAPTIDLSGDLKGARIQMAGLGWTKPADQSGTLRLVGRLGAAPEFTTLRLDTPGLLADGALRLRNGRLSGLNLNRLRVGRWIDGVAQIRPQDDGRIGVALRGGTIHVQHLPKGDGGGDSGSAGLGTATLENMRVVVDDTLALSNVAGSLDLGKSGAGNLTGRVNGGTGVSVRLSEARAGTAIRVRGNNAGRALRDSGLYAQADGGTLDLRLTPNGTAGQFLGKLDVEGITIKDAPVATSLLSAISLVGLAEQIGSGGLHFGKVEAEFLLTPGALIVSESSATGPSLGLSMDGRVNLEAKTVDLQGVLSPFYFLNRIGAGLTRRGEGLLGITFELTGPFKEPTLRANPLSMLTPGMFRELFRRKPPEIREGTPAQ